MAVGGRHHVLPHGHVEEQPQGLEGPRDPLPRDPVRLEPLDALAREDDVALGRLVDPGDQVEERRLARTVRADHADDLALVDMQVEVGHDLEAAERHRHAAAARAGCVAHLDDLHALLAEEPVGPGDHRRDEDRAEHHVPRRLRLGSITFSQTNAAR